MSKVKIRVTPLAQDGADVICAIERDSMFGKHVKGGIVKLKKRKSYELEFYLADGTLSSLQFASNGAAFSSATSGCPQPPAQLTQFRDPTVTNAGKKLTVQADRGTDDIVHYSLSFTDGQRQLICDPIIINE